MEIYYTNYDFKELLSYQVVPETRLEFSIYLSNFNKFILFLDKIYRHKYHQIVFLFGEPSRLGMNKTLKFGTDNTRFYFQIYNEIATGSIR